MFSAYDLKKIIPRAIFALVAVNLSWSLMGIFINIVNALGDGAQALVVWPFQQGSGAIDLTQISLGGGADAALGFGAIGLLAGAIFGLIPVLGVAAAGFFGVMFAFGAILLRRVFLTALVIIAPVAIALGVFPQTEKWGKEWWEWFSKLMLMYPFIMAMFGLSKVAAGILSNVGSSSGGAAGVIYKLGAVSLLIAPYFMVGKALSFAGGAIGKVAGMVNNKDKGAIDWAKKKDAQRVQDNRMKAKDGRYAGNNFATAGVNAGLRRVMNPKSMLSLNKQKRVAAQVQGAAQAEAYFAERYKGALEGLSSEGRLVLANSKGTDRGAKEYIKRQGEEAQRKKLEKLADDVAAHRITQDQADVSAKMARREKEESLTRAHAMLGSVGGVNSTTARLGLKMAAEKGEVRMDQVDRLSSEIATGTGTGFGGVTQRSRVLADSTSSAVGTATQGGWQKKLDELTAKKAAAVTSGETDVATGLTKEINDHLKKNGMRPLDPDDDPDTVEGLAVPGSKVTPGRPGAYTGSQSRSRVVVTDAVTKAAQAAAASDSAALADQVSRVVEHAVIAGTSAAGAVGEKVVNPLNKSEVSEPERQGLHDEVIGKKDGTGR